MGEVATHKRSPGVTVIGGHRHLALAIAVPDGRHVARGVFDRELDVVEPRRLAANGPHLIQGKASHGVHNGAAVELALVIRGEAGRVGRAIARRAAGGLDHLVVVGGSVVCGRGQAVDLVLPTIGRRARPLEGSLLQGNARGVGVVLALVLKQLDIQARRVGTVKSLPLPSNNAKQAYRVFIGGVLEDGVAVPHRIELKGVVGRHLGGALAGHVVAGGHDLDRAVGIGAVVDIHRGQVL